MSWRARCPTGRARTPGPVRARRRATTPIDVTGKALEARIAPRAAARPKLPLPRPRKPASRTRIEPPKRPANGLARKAVGEAGRSLHAARLALRADVTRGAGDVVGVSSSVNKLG